MAPTICSDKKQQKQRCGGITNLRRQARGLQRNGAPTASIINYVAKGIINARSTAQLRLRANSTASNSNESSALSSDNELSNSANNSIRLAEQHHQHQHQHHHQQAQQTTPSSKPKISDSLISSSLPSPTSSISSSASSSMLITNNIEHSNNSTTDFRACSPNNTLCERSMSPYQESESCVQLIYDTDMEDNCDNDDAHSVASDLSEVAIDLSADDCPRHQHKNHQTVFNAPAYGDKQQQTSVICLNTTNKNTTNSNINTTNNNNNNSDRMLSSRDSYYDLCEIKNTEGLLSIAIKTIKLVKRNQMLQRRLAQLQQETSEFIQSVLANPENRHFREKLEQKKGQPQPQQQPAE